MLPEKGEKRRQRRAFVRALATQCVIWIMVAIAMPLYILPTYERGTGEEGESALGLSPPYSAFVARIGWGMDVRVDYGIVVALGMSLCQIIWSLVSFSLAKRESLSSAPHGRESQQWSERRDTAVTDVFLFTIITFVIGSFVWWTLIVLFGASLVDSFWGSLRLALLVSSLTAVPLSATMASATTHHELLAWLFGFPRPSILTQGEVAWTIGVAVAVGTWAGAFPIPLDWDREWQTWPLPCVFGALIGQLLGILACLFRFAAEQGSIRKKAA